MNERWDRRILAALEIGDGRQRLVRPAGCADVAKLEARVAEYSQRGGVVGSLRQDLARGVARLGEPMKGEERRCPDGSGWKVGGLGIESGVGRGFGTQVGGDVARRPGRLEVGLTELRCADDIARVGLEASRPEGDVAGDPLALQLRRAGTRLVDDVRAIDVERLLRPEVGEHAELAGGGDRDRQPEHGERNKRSPLGPGFGSHRKCVLFAKW